MTRKSQSSKTKRNVKQAAKATASTPSKRNKFKSGDLQTSPARPDGRPSSPSESTLQHGPLILYLVCSCPFVSARDLIPLRAVSKSYRDDIDRQLFEHLRIKTVAKRLCVLDAAERKLPGFTPMNAPDALPKHSGILDRLKHAVSVDLEKTSKSHLTSLRPFMPNVHTIRLPSNNLGLHMYQPPAFGDASTMVVFPSFLPQVNVKLLTERKVPPGITKLVQHLSCAVDDHYDKMRGPVLFPNLGPDVTKEVWIFTHYDVKVPWASLGLYDDRVFDAQDSLTEELCMTTMTRLYSGKTDLTLVDDNSAFEHIYEAYQLFIFENCEEGMGLANQTSDQSGELTVEQSLLSMLTSRGVKNTCKLHLKTWDEYMATLTKDEQALECLPDGYAEKLETVPNNYYPPECEKCYLAHHGPCGTGFDLGFI